MRITLRDQQKQQPFRRVSNSLKYSWSAKENRLQSDGNELEQDALGVTVTIFVDQTERNGRKTRKVIRAIKEKKSPKRKGIGMQIRQMGHK